MIGISVSDIVKLLDQIPIWKTVAQLPKRVAALEERCAALETALAASKALPGVSPGRLCDACGAHALRRTERVPMTGQFAMMGLMKETWTCSSCGEVEIREMQK